MIDLRDRGAKRMRVPTDVAHASGHALSQAWSLAFHQHPERVDGILYRSRHNGQVDVAVYYRAPSKLSPTEPAGILTRRRELARVVRTYGIDLLPSQPWMRAGCGSALR